MTFKDFDFAGFWEDTAYARKSYVEAAVTPKAVHAAELALGFRLPAAYVALMHTQNGGIPARTCFPTTSATSWAKDHVAISGIFGIGRTKPHSLLGALGSKFMQAEWGYPTFGICICDCPSAGHDMIMLDYRACGPTGEPTVVHVDQEHDFRVTFLAADFETFVRGLVPESDFDISAVDLEAERLRLRKGRFSTALAARLAQSASPETSEAALRALLEAIAVEKGYFALHGDSKSYLVYDVLFDLHTTSPDASASEPFLDAYPRLIALGDGEVSTRGYAPAFIEAWLKKRLTTGTIVEHAGRLVLTEPHRKVVARKMAKYAS